MGRREYSIVRYSKLIGKNTAEFNSIDMINFLSWLSTGKVVVKEQVKVQAVSHAGPKVQVSIWR